MKKAEIWHKTTILSTLGKCAFLSDTETIKRGVNLMIKAKKPMGGAAKTFLLALFISLAVYVPIIVYGYGCFQYMGDYNVQQIAFYKLAHEAVKSGNIF